MTGTLGLELTRSACIAAAVDETGHVVGRGRAAIGEAGMVAAARAAVESAARAAGGGTMPAILNAANEVAVQAFLDRRIGFTEIPRVIEHTLSSLPASRDVQLDAVLSSDLRARDVASSFIAAREPRVGQGVS